jgi:hypothetical protein
MSASEQEWQSARVSESESRAQMSGVWGILEAVPVWVCRLE